jgi:hypothetical protein
MAADSNGLDLGSSNDLANSAQSQGNSAVSNFDPTTTEGTFLKNNNAMLANQGTANTNFVGQYADAIKNNPTVQSLYDQGNQKYNVQGLASNANYLQNQVTNSLPDAYSASKGFDISAPQVTNGVASRLSYLGPQSTAATNQLQTAQGLASQYVTAGMNQNSLNLLPLQSQQALLAQNEAQQATGYTDANQQELQGLISKMQSGVTMSQEMMGRANTLAAQETAYQTALQNNQATIKAAQIGNNYKLVNAGQGVFNASNATITPYGSSNSTPPSVQAYINSLGNQDSSGNNSNGQPFSINDAGNSNLG